MTSSTEQWSFYIVINNGFTYAGVSPDPVKRLRKHNGEISGGAKYTASKGPGWKHLCLVHGFPDKITSMQFEWAVKHCPPRNLGGIVSRINKLITTLNKKNWTSKSPPAQNIPLTLQWIDSSHRPNDISLPPYVSQSSINDQ